ncbi:hypothetical protein [Gilliamella sp. Pra-s54]|uniref:hypothetical protein n=1 Tax=Gilliamella sp. Pra-s54 TaxID=2687314 RepID=UPI001328ECBE|nr:hypothetical protein [Gilliamella sp. Pra-s54]MWN32166.1 hypothetical protein [Gilliamella sp. Pra-s60]MWP29425.1 hypothetical protein [Gilliamella sp. Pra-s54]
MCRQQSEVSTPNRTFGEFVARLERFHKRCVKTERRRRVAEGHILQPKRGIAKGIRFKFPWLGRVHNSYFIHPKLKRPKPPHSIHSIHPPPKKSIILIKNQPGKVLILLKFFSVFLAKTPLHFYPLPL